MKQNSTKTKAQSQIRLGIGDSRSGLNQSIIRVHTECTMLPIAQHLLKQGRGREGPPGCARSPGSKFRLLIPEPVEGNPDYQTAKSLHRSLSLSKGNGSKNQYNNEYQYFNTKQKTNFLTPLIFKIMKKQILILAFLVVAIFANVSNSYGQPSIHDSSPDVTTCTSDALHPVAGKVYNYAATGTNGGAGSYTWWVTKNTSFITAQGVNNLASREVVGTGLNSASASYGVSSTTGSVDISWGSTLLAGTSYQGAVAGKTPTFVVVQYNAEAGVGCADNMKVYEIDPKNGFLVDILNLDNTTYAKAAYGTNENQCIDRIKTASYNTTSHAMEYDYGQNIFYYEVVAANFSDSWKPFLVFTGFDPVQTYTIDYSYVAPTGTPVWTPYVSGTTTITTNVADNSTGVSFYVRVTVTNHNYEGINNKSLVLTVDGQNKDNAWDVVNSTCIDPLASDSNDKATQVLDRRPTITPNTSSATAPTTIIPGNESNN